MRFTGVAEQIIGWLQVEADRVSKAAGYDVSMLKAYQMTEMNKCRRLSTGLCPPLMGL
jgi:hypothetical protein